MSEVISQEKPTTESTAKIVYILYLVGLVFGVLGVIGLVMAYINQKDAPDWLESHYRFQIRTFWIGLVYLLVGLVLSFVFIGFLVILFWVVWLVIRCIKGMKVLDQKEKHPNPTSWMF